MLTGSTGQTVWVTYMLSDTDSSYSALNALPSNYFTKVDGTERTMPCTLRTDVLPPQELTEHHKTKVYKPETLSVWCLDKSEWRSFRTANVTHIKVVE